jgi:DNA repair exonuclease SbcCD ATPase subunit
MLKMLSLTQKTAFRKEQINAEVFRLERRNKMPEEEKTEKTEVKTEVKTEDDVKTEEQKQEWDKERQRADQAEANLRKVSAEKAELSDQVANLTDEIASTAAQSSSLETKLEQLKSEIEDKKDQIQLDPDIHDPSLIKKIAQMEERYEADRSILNDQKKQIESLEEVKAQYEADRAENDRVSEQKKREEAILSTLDDEFAPKYRNDAMKLAQEEVTKLGEAPKGEWAIGNLLRKHYKHLWDADTKKGEKEETVQTDTGTGGVVFKEGDIKEGSFEEVKKQLAKKYKKLGRPFSTPDI